MHFWVIITCFLSLIALGVSLSPGNYKEKWNHLKSLEVSHGSLVHEDLAPHYFPETGVGLQANAHIVNNTVLLRLPRSVLFDSLKVLTYFPKFKLLWPFLHYPDLTVVSAFLGFLLQHNNLDLPQNLEPLKIYADTLPDSCLYGVGVTDSASSLLPLKLRKMKKKWDRFVKHEWNFLEKAEPFAHLFPGLKLSREFFLKGLCMRKTRSFLQREDSIESFLVPLGDWMNHNANPNVEYRYLEQEGVFEFTSRRLILKDEQLFIGYGPLSSEALFLFFGFVLPFEENSYEGIELEIPLPDSSDPNAAMKKHILKSIKPDDSLKAYTAPWTTLSYSRTNGISRFDFGTIRLLTLRDFEFSSFNISRALSAEHYEPDTWVSSENEVLSIQMIANMCIDYANELSELPEDQNSAQDWEYSLILDLRSNQSQLTLQCLTAFGVLDTLDETEDEEEDSVDPNE